MERTYTHRKHPVLRVLRFLGFIALGAVAAAAFAFIFGYLIMLLWNWLMPTLFGLITITFWQAVGIAFLARLIFGGGKHGPDHPKKHSPKSKFFDHWKDECKNGKKYEEKAHFNEFWNGEGEQAYQDFIERKQEQEQK